MSDNLAFNDLQELILGQRKESLADMEVRNLFSSQPITAEFIIRLIMGLKCDSVDPNIVLLQAIANATEKKDVLPIALAIRYGADPNMYVDAPNVGDIHLLGYCYLVLNERDVALLNSVVIMLMRKKANPSLCIFKEKKRDEFSLIEPIKGQSVIEWLEDQGFDTIIPRIEENYNDVNKTYLTFLGVLLDDKTLIVDEPNPMDIISSHSNDLFEIYCNNDAGKIMGLDLSIRYLNCYIFEKLINEGTELRYDQVNDLILLIGKYIKLNDIISLDQIKTMLFYVISKGQNIDLYQFELLKRVTNNSDDGNNDIICQFITIYTKPYWKKISKAPGKTSDRLRDLAYNLNLRPDYPRSTICRQVRKIAQADPNKVKYSAVERQKSRIITDVAFINQFDDCRYPEIVCRNINLVGNLYDHPDVEIAYYRDENDSFWCFLSNDFDKILEGGKNPYTNAKFPEYFLKKVKKQQKFIKKYRIKETGVSEAVDSLHEPDEISNAWTDIYVGLFFEMSKTQDTYDWNLESMTNKDLETILYDNFSISVNLNSLSMKHAKKTFYVVSYFELKSHPEKMKSFYKQISEMNLK